LRLGVDQEELRGVRQKAFFWEAPKEFIDKSVNGGIGDEDEEGLAAEYHGRHRRFYGVLKRCLGPKKIQYSWGRGGLSGAHGK
jgi:hypothetical protein